MAGCSSKLRQLKHVPAVKLTPNVNIDSSEMLEWSCDDSSLATLEQQEQRTAARGKRRLETKWWRSVQQSHAVALNTDTRSVQIPNVKLCCICSELGLIAMCLQSICIYILDGSYLETHWQPQDNQWVQSEFGVLHALDNFWSLTTKSSKLTDSSLSQRVSGFMCL